MPRPGWILLPAILLVALHPRAQIPAARPLFRGGTDLVQVDVSVLDSKRHPVRGLTAADFTVLEDGQPREIQAFSEVYLPDRVRAEAAPWVHDVASDVVSNQIAEDEGRLVMILLDRSIPLGEPTLVAKRIATAAVSQLGPGDLASVVSTSNGATQNLTSDRARLLRAINESDVSTGISEEAREIMERFTPLNPLSDGRCLCGLCVLETITRVADAVQSAPRRRKVLFFIGSDLVFQSAGEARAPDADVGCGTRLRDARDAMFAALDRSNMTVHSVDPAGLMNVSPGTRASSLFITRSVADAAAIATTEHLKRQGALSVLPDRTGGRAVMNTNAPELQVSSIFRESDSYYLIGFRPADSAANGRFHEIRVTTNRRGLDVRARSGYTAPSRPERGSSTPAGSTIPAPLRASLTGLLPTSGTPVDVSASTFAAPGSGRGAVTLAVGVGAFRAAPSGDGAAPHEVPLEVVATAFDRGGRPKGVARQRLELSWPASATQEARFDVLSRLDLPPGDYEIRVGVSGSEPARTASVFTYITVPAFDSTPLSLSSLVIGAPPGTFTAPKDFLAPLFAIVPTARRNFATSDRLLGFLRIYQGTSRKDPLLPVQLQSSVIDAQGRVVAKESARLDAAQFEKGRSADHYFALPLVGLAPGEYLLRIETEMGPRVAGRALRFSVN
jgi:VWFA-related protein